MSNNNSNNSNKLPAATKSTTKSATRRSATRRSAVRPPLKKMDLSNS
jgi:hypothetical protein